MLNLTIGGWVLFFFIAAIVLTVGIMGAICTYSIPIRVTAIVLTLAIIIATLFGELWYFRNTASGQRVLVDQKSNLGQGLERTVTVYTADGDIIARYSGRIDVEATEGGYIKFDLDGKRYIYYNCFVETIAEIDQ